MKRLHYYLIYFLLAPIILSTFSSCSSDESNSKSTVFNIQVLDSDSLEPIENAIVEICNSAYFCTNILARGTTNADGKIKLSLNASDMTIARSFTVYKENYRNNTSFLDQLNLTEEIIVYMSMYQTAD
ncbi:hypothetical protein NO995_05325 [Aestuariibaculum sp. M13]|uniref:hypothetical protein n=1 Tax=Aestuariibaculum sp. M13 TaxID=2967132 RepID=UPI002159F2EC|nr:hypothetical protein [Aestuariibaculum sp. M13]MCR8667093.1 hypothetical protein [Aestuariibaculum sp. M13]